MSTESIRIQLADDHEIVRAGFRHLLEREGDMQVVTESASGKQACRDYDTHHPDIMIMDISLPDISGLEAMRRILQDHPQARILILSMHAGMVVERAMQMGAKGFVCKRSGSSELISAVRAIMAGQTFVDADVDESQPGGWGRTRRPPPTPPLTKREIEICTHLVKGHTVTEIAQVLHLSEKTVYTHRQHLMNKLGVNTDVELARIASNLGIHL